MQEYSPDWDKVGKKVQFNSLDDLSNSLHKLMEKGNGAVIYQDGIKPVIVKPKRKNKKLAFYGSRKQHNRIKLK